MEMNALVEQWRVMRATQTKPVTDRNRRQVFARYLYPKIEGLDAEGVKPKDALALIEWVMEDATIHIGKRILCDLITAYDYAAVLGQVAHNPFARLHKFLPRAETKGRAFLPPRDFARFLREVDAHKYGCRTVRNALYALVFSAQRRGEIILAQWAEIDAVNRIWTIPARRMKNGRPHVIPISSPLMALLEEQRRLGSPWVFPSPRDNAQPINKHAVYFMLRALGYAKKQTVHGFRKVFSTRANESGLWENKLIEKHLSHAPRDVEAVYDHSSMIEPRRRMMEWWADQIQQWRGLI